MASSFIGSVSFYDEKNAKAIEFIEEITKNVDSVQQRVLGEILSQNENAEYLQRFKLDGATDRETFKSKVPVVTYEDIKPDIQRIVNGDKSPIFSSQRISQLLISSGTSSGEKKLIPTIDGDFIRSRDFFDLFMPILNLYIPSLEKGKCLDFIITMEESRTPGGILIQPALSRIYKNPLFRNKPYDPYLVYTSPIETILCTDNKQSMYTQMLCGLLMRAEVLRLGATFASGIIHAIQFLQLNWKQLSHDIETGTLNPTMVTDPSVRDCMSKILSKPNPEIAELIYKECESENWENIIQRIWPNTKYLKCVVTGSMAQYIPSLDYYSGGLPLVCTDYSSTECHFGINLKPLSKPYEVSYTIMPNMGYFEFIHYDNDLPSLESSNISEYRPYLVDLADLEIGKEYEIVVTTYAGLCRYRIGDIVQVTGYHNSTPQLKFVKRKDVILCIDIDKTSEVELQRGIDSASALLRPYNVHVSEYTSYADVMTVPGHYVIYLELFVEDTTSEWNEDVLNECCLAIEESLNCIYRKRRRDGYYIGPLEIKVLKKGTFVELMEYAISRGASINQYKVPRCIHFTPIIKLLDSRVISTHFSPKEPHLTPDA